jgi:hypothetical protein
VLVSTANEEVVDIDQLLRQIEVQLDRGEPLTPVVGDVALATMP